MISPRSQRPNGIESFWTLMISLGICEEIHDNIRWSPKIRAVIANPRRVFGAVLVVTLMVVLYSMFPDWVWTDESASNHYSAIGTLMKETIGDYISDFSTEHLADQNVAFERWIGNVTIPSIEWTRGHVNMTPEESPFPTTNFWNV